MAPGEDILVLFEKSRDCVADQRIGKGANPSCSILSRVVERYLFKSFNGLCHSLLFFYVHGP